LGTALIQLGDADEGEAVLAPLADAATTDQDLVDVAVARYRGATSRRIRPEFGSVLMEAEQRVRDPALRAFLRAQRATLLAFAGDFDASLALASTADTAADDTSLELASIRAVPALGVASILTGHTDRAVDIAKKMLEPALRRVEEMPEALFWVLTTLVNGLTFGGRLAEADAVVALAHDTLAKERVAAETTTYFSFARGNIELMRGRASAARSLLADVVFDAAQDDTSRPPGLALAGAFLVEACALLGDTETAEAASIIATRTIARVGAFEGGLRRSRAWLAVARGQFVDAAELAIDAAGWARAHGQTTAELHSLHDAVRLGRARGVLERLSNLASVTEGLWAPLFAANARARATDDGVALDEVASSFEDIGAWLLAAEAAAHAARAHHRVSLDTRAQRSRARAQTLLARCDCAHLQTIPELGTPSALSPREREVALLAARGLTSREVGDRLCLSRRTVEGHLQRAYTKLGISDRSSLAKALDS
jgi:DNA-binding CsgD family transcriptional regulator